MKTLIERFRALAIAAVVGLCATASIAQVATASPAAAAAAQPQAAQDIRDIRPPYHIRPGWLWMLWVGGAAAVIALGYAAWRLRRWFGVSVKLPYEIALERLEAARKYMQPEQARVFSIAVSEVIRDYIEQCFSVRAAHRTTNEFIRDLATRIDSPLVAHQSVLTDFLHHCDLAKFACWNLSVAQMEAMLSSAGSFIIATGKPAATPVRILAASPAQAASFDSTTTTLQPQLS